MRGTGAVIALLVAGCDGVFGLGHIYPQNVDDGGIPVLDTTIDGPPAVTCTNWPKPRHFDPCALPTSNGVLNLSIAGTYLLDTSTGMFTNPAAMSTTLASLDAGFARIIAVDAFVIAQGTTLRVVGNKPLLIASWSTIVVSGVLDASSQHSGMAGAGARASCANMAGDALANDGGGGGGGGGGFQGAGGSGGTGNSEGTTAGPAGSGGAAAPFAFAGGCRGGNGGTATQVGASGGAGGGAIQLTGRMQIAIAGTIHVGGAGGGGAIAKVVDGNGGGGGGGGSGGAIDLEAPMVTINAAILAANGGGGGEGSDETRGNNGSDAQPGVAAAAGGIDGSVAGNGGAGSGLGSLVGGIGEFDRTDGGGGGGGGAGYIVIASPMLQTLGAPIISPPHNRL